MTPINNPTGGFLSGNPQTVHSQHPVSVTTEKCIAVTQSLKGSLLGDDFSRVIPSFLTKNQQAIETTSQLINF